jgi:hypothetical protein
MVNTLDGSLVILVVRRRADDDKVVEERFDPMERWMAEDVIATVRTLPGFVDAKIEGGTDG